MSYWSCCFITLKLLSKVKLAMGYLWRGWDLFNSNITKSHNAYHEYESLQSLNQIWLINLSCYCRLLMIFNCIWAVLPWPCDNSICTTNLLREPSTWPPFHKSPRRGKLRQTMAFLMWEVKCFWQSFKFWGQQGTNINSLSRRMKPHKQAFSFKR